MLIKPKHKDAISLNFQLYIQVTAAEEGNIQIEIEILQFDNPTGTVFPNNNFSAERRACDPQTQPTTRPNYCDPLFSFCVGR